MDAIRTDDIFKCIFLDENDKITIQVALKCIPRIPIDNKPALAPNRRQAITWTNVDPVHWRVYAALERESWDKKWCF